ncbi:helix-turn-helix domain-containing protein [Aetokthonos hydrillicola Thurmond2011]|uniref:Helix-turn-helix domain-containing protein n=3 Tax=Aetokthonos TaxID=1550243 RepID=A0AAP5IFP4_9CYAN|nr:helix-turn-helix domain-containing protein [Aetokthonos hydrillicola]MBO3459954.1 helix-turn-helix domain-containing protein [Aetokthonos hydrillicola CCALA 1050]MBW4584073.1 helix-turn-helix domain-containing protein [Aetokthonos hydrillicola CCALA 1050]MDR9900715.1 helix-turn-helix domain-containing protein [Aetokthonos hydrillicola Thurmond2011]
METQIDRYPVSELTTRYNVGKSKLYADYLAQCKIKPAKIQGRSYVLSEDLKRLDEYHVAQGLGEEAIAQFLQTLPDSDDDSALVHTNITSVLQNEFQACSGEIMAYYRIANLSQKFLLTIQEASILSGMPKAEIRRAIKEKKLAAVKMGATKVRQIDLQEYIEFKFQTLTQANLIPSVSTTFK